MMANTDRAEKAYRTIVNYESDSSTEEWISDLLGDLRHLCDEQGYDFAERDGVGHRNYLSELRELGDGGRAEQAEQSGPELERCIRDLRLNGLDAVADDLTQSVSPGEVVKRMNAMGDDEGFAYPIARITAYMDGLAAAK